MPTLRSATALGVEQPDVKLRQRRNSGSSSDSSDLITYDEDKPRASSSSNEATRDHPRTTKQKVDRRPPSTFHLKSFKEQTNAERLCNLATCPEDLHLLKDDSIDRGPVPSQGILRENLFILSRAMIPIALHQASMYAFPNYKWPFGLAYVVYLTAFMYFALSVVWRMNDYCQRLGTFDEKQIGRDRTPDKSVKNLAVGIVAYMLVRTGFMFYLHYDKNADPLSSITWTFPLRLALWELAMDYFFYCYHRSSHEIDALWFVHQHHHTTKHPTAILAILAEHYQEYLEIFFIPLAATLLVPMSFSESYLTLAYTIYVEMLGHSGVRSYWPHPVLFGLRLVDAELIVEDHELHHRFGKSGRNYGKQTRLYDRIFGTVGERIECYSNQGPKLW